MRHTFLFALYASLCFPTFVRGDAQDAKLLSILDSKTKQIDKAFLKGDLGPVIGLFSPKAMIIDPGGTIISLEDVARSIRSGALKYTSAEVSEEKLAQFGDVAIFTYLSTEAGTMQGNDISGKYRYTQVWARESGEWKLVAVQISVATSQTP